MRIDLHSHSNLSDGTDAPADLLARAAGAGLDVLALTDHDHALGWETAAAAAVEHGIALLPGIEVSTRFRGEGVHLLAYLPDPSYPPLRETLDRTRGGRDSRLEEWVRRGAGLGIAVDRDRVLAYAGGSASISKNHLADALVESGAVATREEAFSELLGTGMPLHVRRFAPELTEAIALVAAAGGVSVLAHPWHRESRNVLDEEVFATLREAGLAGVEVDHEGHTVAERTDLRRIAAGLDLVVTGSSDYHGTAKPSITLGCNTTAPEAYERLLGLAAEAGAASGRRTPEVAGASGR